MERQSLSMEQHPFPPLTSRRGGWRAIKYILGNESFEKLAAMSLIGNITVYLRTQYNMGGTLVVNVVTIWSATQNGSCLVGAFLSDAVLGRFLTLLFGTFSSLLGMGMVAVTAGVPQLKPPNCDGQLQCIQPQRWQLGILFSGLGLLALGAGLVRPCNIAFGADQFDTRTEKGRKQLESFFNWWYFSFSIALLIALTGVVYVETNISWMIGFIIPTACLAFSITIFLMGRHTYIHKKPQGSVFIDMFRVISAAFRKRKLNVEELSEVSYFDPPLSEEQMEQQTVKLFRTERLKCLDKAALMVDHSELDAHGVPVSNWLLCSVHQVEQLKCLIGIIPVWVSGIGCLLSMDQQNTFGMLQAIQMDNTIGHFKIPPGWMTLATMLSLTTWIILYEWVYIPKAKKILKRDARINMSHRIRTGIIMSILCMLVAGTVETRRRDMALKHNSFTSPLSILYLLPQFALSGLIEAFAAVAVMEYLTVQLPQSMRSVSGAIFFLTFAVTNYLSSLIVNVIHNITSRNGKTPWLGGHDLNKNRLEYYYFIIASLSVINLIYFTFVASDYISCGQSVNIGGGVGEGLQLESISVSRRNFGSCEIKVDEEETRIS